MAGEHDDRHIRIGERARRAHNAHESGAVEPGHVPVENDDVRFHGADQLETGRAVRRLVHVADADAHEHGAHDLAHVVLVIHHHDLGGGEALGELVSNPIGIGGPLSRYERDGH